MALADAPMDDTQRDPSASRTLVLQVPPCTTLATTAMYVDRGVHPNAALVIDADQGLYSSLWRQRVYKATKSKEWSPVVDGTIPLVIHASSYESTRSAVLLMRSLHRPAIRFILLGLHAHWFATDLQACKATVLLPVDGAECLVDHGRCLPLGHTVQQLDQHQVPMGIYSARADRLWMASIAQHLTSNTTLSIGLATWNLQHAFSTVSRQTDWLGGYGDMGHLGARAVYVGRDASIATL
jgi:hypothetical protein